MCGSGRARRCGWGVGAGAAGGWCGREETEDVECGRMRMCAFGMWDVGAGGADLERGTPGYRQR